MQKQEAAAAYRNKGQMYRLNNNLQGAVTCLQKAVELDEKDHESHAMLAGIFSRTKDVQRAVVHALFAVTAQPQNEAYKKSFIEIAGAVPFVKHSKLAEDAMLACLETQGLDCSEAQGLWHSLIALNPDLAKIYDADKRTAPMPNINDEKTAATLCNPLFLLGLEQIVVTRRSFENFITGVRKQLLDAQVPVALVSAVACYAFNTEYILDVTEEEKAKVAALRAEVESVPDAARAVLLGCYMPLSALKNMDAVGAVLGNTRLAKLQIYDAKALQRRREAIEAVTQVDDAVSAKVQEQYEEFPYPRWSAAPKVGYNASIRKLLPEGALNVLVAGCGTGREAIQLALSLPESKILAVDLSRTSLAYATGKAEELGVRNITFRQGDILRLGQLQERFDYIASSGVLHHMQDPMAGWRVLHDLLKPKGVMYIGLYSEVGRPDIIAARAAIAQEGLSSKAEDMRLFRKKCRALLPEKMADILEKRRDYYSLSMCRDLVFHVQEHRFDIPQLKKSFQTLGLEFVRFDSSAMPADKNLDVWQALEEKNPWVFKDMYRFWCRKPE